MKKKWFVYILKCRDESYYTGITIDIDKRTEAHRKGLGSRYVRSRLPFSLVYLQEMSGKSSAMKRENEIKGMDRAGKEKMISG
jgi:putative endonuclease